MEKIVIVFINNISLVIYCDPKIFLCTIKDLQLEIIDEKYDAEAFGNFYITLAADEFLIQYSNDRGDLYLEIASKYAPSKWHSLSFYKNLITHRRPINSDEDICDLQNIKQLNSFLVQEYDLINDLLNRDNYKHTLEKLGALLKEEFKRKYPGAVK